MYSQPSRDATNSVDAIPYSEAFSVLQQKSRAELDRLMNSSDEFDDLINGLAMVKKLSTDKESLMVTNASLAEYNISLEPRLISSREDLAQQYGRMVEIQKQCEGIVIQVESSAVNNSPETTLALLQTELAKTEEESEKIADLFSVDGKSADVDSFISQYVALRTLAHMRRIKVEKMTEMVNRGTHQQQPVPSVLSATTSAIPPPIPQRPMYGPPPPLTQTTPMGWSPNPNPPYPVGGPANGWQPYPQYPNMHQPPLAAGYMHR